MLLIKGRREASLITPHPAPLKDCERRIKPTVTVLQGRKERKRI